MNIRIKRGTFTAVADEIARINREERLQVKR